MSIVTEQKNTHVVAATHQDELDAKHVNDQKDNKVVGDKSTVNSDESTEGEDTSTEDGDASSTEDGEVTDDDKDVKTETPAEALERVGTLTGTEGTPVSTLPATDASHVVDHVIVESPDANEPEVSPKRAKEIEEDLARVGTLSGTEGTPV